MRLLPKTLGVAVALLATSASAQSPPPAPTTEDPPVTRPVACSDVEPQAVLDAARRHFGAGRTLVDAGAFPEAETELRAALRLYDSPNSHYLLGRAMRRQHRAAEAYNEFDLTIGLAARCSQADAARGVANRYQQTVSLALRERDELTTEVTIVGIRLVDHTPPRVSVSVNNSPVTADQLGRAFAYAPGEVSIQARAEGFAPFQEVRQCAAGQTSWVDVSLVPAPTRLARPAAQARSLSRPAGLVAGAVGLLAVGVGGTMFFVGGAQYAHLRSQCTPTCPYDAGYVAQLDGGQALETAGIATFWVGVGVAAVGAVVFIASGRTAGHTGRAVSIWPGIDPLHRTTGLHVTF